jgi:hypothetical protein
MTPTAPQQLYRIEIFTNGALQIARKTPVDAAGLPELYKPVIYESAVSLRNPQNPAMQMNITFSIPANSPGQAFANWQMARESAERHVASELRSKIIRASVAGPFRRP